MTSDVARRRQLHLRVVLRLHALTCAAEGTSAAVADEAAERLLEALDELLADEQSLQLQNHAGVMFLNGAKLVPDALTLPAVEGLGPRFFAARLEGVVIEPGVELEELLALARALNAADPERPPESRHLHGIEADEAEPGAPAPRAHGTYIKSIYLTNLLLEALPGPSPVEVRTQKQLVQALVETLLAHPAVTSLLQNLQDQRGPSFEHAVRVAVYAMLLGRRLGLAGADLGQLGIAALFRDVPAAAPGTEPAAPLALGLRRAALFKRIVELVDRYLLATGGRGRLAHAAALAQLRELAPADPVRAALLTELDLAVTSATAR